jgi:hypothetical protein
VYVVGDSYSLDFPTTGGAYQHDYAGFYPGGNLSQPDQIGFVSKLSPDGGGLYYSTYLGGNTTQTSVTGVAVDSTGAAYVTGDIFNPLIFNLPLTFPLTRDAYNTIPASGSNAFAAKYPLLVTSANILDFGIVSVGTQSAPHTVTLSNIGTVSVAITDISSSGDFSETHDCGSALAAGNSCTINVVFTPSSDVSARGTLSITSNDAPNTPNLIPLSGNGQPALSLSAPAVDFGAVTTGSTSMAQAVTLTNSGTGVLTINNVTVSSGFSLTSGCSSTLTAGEGCPLNLTAKPTTAGTITGSITIVSNAPTSPDTVTLSVQAQDQSSGGDSGSAGAIDAELLGLLGFAALLRRYCAKLRSAA